MLASCIGNNKYGLSGLSRSMCVAGCKPLDSLLHAFVVPDQCYFPSAVLAGLEGQHPAQSANRLYYQSESLTNTANRHCSKAIEALDPLSKQPATATAATTQQQQQQQQQHYMMQ